MKKIQVLQALHGATSIPQVWMISAIRIIGVGVRIILLLLRSEQLSRFHGRTHYMKLLQMRVWIFTCKTMKLWQQMGQSRLQLITNLSLKILNTPWFIHNISGVVSSSRVRLLLAIIPRLFFFRIGNNKNSLRNKIRNRINNEFSMHYTIIQNYTIMHN